MSYVTKQRHCHGEYPASGNVQRFLGTYHHQQHVSGLVWRQRIPGEIVRGMVHPFTLRICHRITFCIALHVKIIVKIPRISRNYFFFFLVQKKSPTFYRNSSHLSAKLAKKVPRLRGTGNYFSALVQHRVLTLAMRISPTTQYRHM